MRTSHWAAHGTKVAKGHNRSLRKSLRERRVSFRPRQRIRRIVASRIPARVHGRAVGHGAFLWLFWFGLIESTGRWVNTGTGISTGRPVPSDGGDGHTYVGPDGNFALRFSGSQLFTAAV